MNAPLSFLDGQTVAVMGLGKSGRATLRALQTAGIHALAWDDQQESRDRASADGFFVSDLSEVSWSQIDLLVWSPGIPHVHPTPHPVAVAARRAGVKLVCDVELLSLANLASHYIGITGTNGKSTTTSLIGHLLSEAGKSVAVGGNLGIAALDLPMLDADGFYVIELSSYQLELLDQCRLDIALLLNITPDHLARHGGMEGYIEAKSSIFQRLRGDGLAVIGVDDPPCRAIHETLRERKPAGRLCAISAERFVAGGVSAADGILIDDREGKASEIIALGDLAALPGRHNWQNVCAAYAVAHSVGVGRETIIAGLRSFPGLKHRQEIVASIDGVVYVNDSKATNADATARALACYEAIHWILGGQPKEGGISALADFFPRIQKAYLIGEASELFAATLEGSVDYQRCGTLEAALMAARRDAQPGSVVLLSPACASWDQFTSFEQRGDIFRDLVKQISVSRGAA